MTNKMFHACAVDRNIFHFPSGNWQPRGPMAHYKQNVSCMHGRPQHFPFSLGKTAASRTQWRVTNKMFHACAVDRNIFHFPSRKSTKLAASRTQWRMTNKMFHACAVDRNIFHFPSGKSIKLAASRTQWRMINKMFHACAVDRNIFHCPSGQSTKSGSKFMVPSNILPTPKK